MRKRIMYWLWDGWPYELKGWGTVAAGSWVLCKLFGHEPIRDHCGRPEHDLCVWCSKSMPHAAPRPVPSSPEETPHA